VKTSIRKRWFRFATRVLISFVINRPGCGAEAEPARLNTEEPDGADEFRVPGPSAPA
jgi:hypothetical protein